MSLSISNRLSLESERGGGSHSEIGRASRESGRRAGGIYRGGGAVVGGVEPLFEFGEDEDDEEEGEGVRLESMEGGEERRGLVESRRKEFER